MGSVITEAQMRALHARAATYPALNDALLCLHECALAAFQDDARAAADDAAKACYDFADEAKLYRGAAE